MVLRLLRNLYISFKLSDLLACSCSLKHNSFDTCKICSDITLVIADIVNLYFSSPNSMSLARVLSNLLVLINDQLLILLTFSIVFSVLYLIDFCSYHYYFFYYLSLSCFFFPRFIFWGGMCVVFA